MNAAVGGGGNELTGAKGVEFGRQHAWFLDGLSRSDEATKYLRSVPDRGLLPLLSSRGAAIEGSKAGRERVEGWTTNFRPTVRDQRRDFLRVAERPKNLRKRLSSED